MEAWEHESMKTWQHVTMEAWNHESMEARKHGNMHGGEAWNDKESHLYRWNLAIIFTYGIMESWKY